MTFRLNFTQNQILKTEEAFVEAREPKETDRIQVISWRLGHRNPVHILERGPLMITQKGPFVHFSAQGFIQVP